MLRLRFSISVMLSALCLACSTEHPDGPSSTDETPDVIPTGFTISNPVFLNAASTGIVAARVASGSAYVSAAPHTFPETIKYALVKNEASPVLPARTNVVDGGFDPVGIDGAPGDSVSVSLYTSTSDLLSVLHTKIPPRRPPRVVRTNPGTGRVDVALNTVIEIVFTEPIDKTTVNASSLRLNRGADAVESSVTLSPDGLIARVTPATPLAPLTSYTVTLSGAIRDLDGETISDPPAIDFATSQPTGLITVRIQTTSVDGGVTDPDGYFLQVDDQSPMRVEPVSVQSFNAFSGNHIVSLAGLSDNCFVNANRLGVVIVVGVTTTVEFQVRCTPIPPVPQGVIAFVSDRDGNPEIYTSNTDGTNLRRLTNTANLESDPEWSPDGKRIAFTRWRTLDPPNKSSDEAADIYIMDADGSNVVRLTEDGINYAPAWSPDGKQIAYVYYASAPTRIRVQSVDNKDVPPVEVGFDTGWSQDPVWSPDGEHIVFASDVDYYDGATRLFQVGIKAGDTPREVPLPYEPNFSVYYLQPSWSPNGERIAIAECDWYYQCGGPGFIAVASLDGAEHKRLVETSNIQHPTWSPDGAFIAYSAQTCRLCSPPSVSYVSTDGTRKGTIISNAYSPSWRPSPR